MNSKSAVSAIALVFAVGTATALAQSTPNRPAGPNTPAQQSPQAKPAAPPKPIEGQIVMQSDNTVLASSLIGAQVSGSDGDGTAEINDVIIKTDGTIEGVVVGVGGFLGIGEHSVAVQWDKIKLQLSDDGKTRGSLSASKEDLKAAPPFKSKQAAKAETQSPQQPRPATGAGGAPASSR